MYVDVGPPTKKSIQTMPCCAVLCTQWFDDADVEVVAASRAAVAALVAKGAKVIIKIVLIICKMSWSLACAAWFLINLIDYLESRPTNMHATNKPSGPG